MSDYNTTALEDLKLWLQDKSSFDLFTKLDNKIDELMVKDRMTHRDAAIFGYALHDAELAVNYVERQFPNHPTNGKLQTQTKEGDQDFKER